ncbi:MAG: AraC family transcriptional regulator [Clostridia bacterium]|jgi:AraC-like DNA-binding protein|nr:AraC family transcriptional regulator [Clostridia bacterium]
MSGNYKKNILRARPRLLYAGSFTGNAGWQNEKRPAEAAEIVVVGKGGGKAEIGDDTYPFAAGDVIVYNRGCAHREWLDDTPQKELLFFGVGNLHIGGLEPDAVLKDRPFCLVHAGDAFGAIYAYASQLLTESESALPLHETMAGYLLRLLLLSAVRLSAYDGEMLEENRNYTEAKRYFDEHYAEIDSIDAVCKSLYINKYYLSHLFTQKMGIPPVRYLMNKRIELACHYLETTDWNMADVGKACGYADPCYFSRLFKRTKKITPLRYRYLFKLEKEKKEKKK